MRTALFAAALAVAAPAPAALAASADDVLATYADIAHAGYADSLATARDLKAAVDALVAEPSAASLAAARQAWLDARVPYQQTEVYRFGNPMVDAWEGRVNAWPLDEGLIDYVKADNYAADPVENPYGTANVVASPSLTLSGRTIDADPITKELLSDQLHEVDGIEANVATGYHAVEFLLWGQDLNGTGPGAGDRPWTDFATTDECTHGNCGRRAAYLTTATNLLIDDLAEMTAAWAPDGAARADLTAQGTERGLGRMLMGMGSLSYGELAGERMKLGLMLHDPEEEHDCFSDNTHNAHYYDAKGIRNVWQGRYVRTDGAVVEGPSLKDLVAAKDPALAESLSADFAATEAAMAALVAAAEQGEAYDQMLAMGNAAGNARIQAAIDALTAQTRGLEKVMAVLDVPAASFEGSDSLDAPEKVAH